MITRKVTLDGRDLFVAAPTDAVADRVEADMRANRPILELAVRHKPSGRIERLVSIRHDDQTVCFASNGVDFVPWAECEYA